MPETPETTIGRLDERLKSLEKKTDDHHNTVMIELRDIKENINPRLLSLESRVYTKGDFTEFYKAYVTAQDEQDTKLDDLSSWQNRVVGGLIIINIILGVLLTLVAAGKL